MIARIWTASTSHEDAPKYIKLFKEKVLPKVTSGVPGYKGVNLLQYVGDDEVTFTTIFWFESLEAVKAFAGQDYTSAIIPDVVRDLFIRFDTTVKHHNVLI